MSVGDLVPPTEVRVGDHVHWDDAWHLVIAKPDRMVDRRAVIPVARMVMPIVTGEAYIPVLTPARWIDRVDAEINSLRYDAEAVQIVQRMTRAPRTSDRTGPAARPAR